MRPESGTVKQESRKSMGKITVCSRLTFISIALALLIFVGGLESKAEAAGVCRAGCSGDSDCATGLVCYNGLCVNAWCPESGSCVCGVGNVDVKQENKQTVNVNVSNEIRQGEVLAMKVPSVTPITGGGADAVRAGLLSFPLLFGGLLLRKYRG